MITDKSYFVDHPLDMDGSRFFDVTPYYDNAKDYIKNNPTFNVTNVMALSLATRRQLVEEEKAKGDVEEIAISDTEPSVARRSTRRSSAASKLREEDEDEVMIVDEGEDGGDPKKASGSGSGTGAGTASSTRQDKGKGVDRDQVMEVVVPRPRYVTTALGAEFGKCFSPEHGNSSHRPK